MWSNQPSRVQLINRYCECCGTEMHSTQTTSAGMHEYSRRTAFGKSELTCKLAKPGSYFMSIAPLDALSLSHLRHVWLQRAQKSFIKIELQLINMQTSTTVAVFASNVTDNLSMRGFVENPRQSNRIEVLSFNSGCEVLLRNVWLFHQTPTANIKRTSSCLRVWLSWDH